MNLEEKKKLLAADAEIMMNRLYHAYDLGYQIGRADANPKCGHCAIDMIRNGDYTWNMVKYVDSNGVQREAPIFSKNYLKMMGYVEEKTARWIKMDIGYKCSNCPLGVTEYATKGYRYCPNCGAKMEGEND